MNKIRRTLAWVFLVLTALFVVAGFVAAWVWGGREARILITTVLAVVVFVLCLAWALWEVL